MDALVFSPEAKYVYGGRDGRDVILSMHNHHANQIWYEMINDSPDRVGPAIGRPTADPVAYFNDWFAGDGYPW